MTSVPPEAVRAALAARADLLSDRPSPTALSEETLVRLMLEAAAPAMAGDTAGWEPGRWWRVTDPDGSLWCETSSEEEARESARPGDRLQRLYVSRRERWQDMPEQAQEGEDHDG